MNSRWLAIILIRLCLDEEIFESFCCRSFEGVQFRLFLVVDCNMGIEFIFENGDNHAINIIDEGEAETVMVLLKFVLVFFLKL
jgi:hypothetical protein